eukprot:5343-Heterococcus_DN1.PRE.2
MALTISCRSSSSWVALTASRPAAYFAQLRWEGYYNTGSAASYTALANTRERTLHCRSTRVTVAVYTAKHTGTLPNDNYCQLCHKQ